MISVIVPIYKNEENLPALLRALIEIESQLTGSMEVVFVVDGSPDESYVALKKQLPRSGLRAQLLLLSKNFGAFYAVRAGLVAARGDWCAVMAADLQEPIELIVEFDRRLASGETDVVVGKRIERRDSWFSKLCSNAYWWIYRRFVEPAIPAGGVDVFACTAQVRDVLANMPETTEFLIGQLFWVGFRRETVPYKRRERQIGKSAWTLRKKITYFLDSLFAFTDLPIRLLTIAGILGLMTGFSMAVIVVFARVFSSYVVPGYAATVMLVIFFGSLNCLGLGIIGNYVWRAFLNTHRRPNFIVAASDQFGYTEDD